MKTTVYIVVSVLIFSELTDCARRGRNRQQQQQEEAPAPATQEETAAQPEEVIAAACTTTCGGDSVLDESTCRCRCPKGYKYIRQRCEDVNECHLFPDRCLGDCTNLVGSFKCRCPDGYVLHTNGWDCKPVPKIVACRGRVCFDGSTLNTISCRCECGQGKRYNFFAEQCDDINECITDSHSCAHGCINVPRGYKCYCPYGFAVSTDQRNCHPVTDTREIPCNGKECGTGAVLDAHHCACECQKGFVYDVITEACVDIDECYDYRGWCDGECVNNVGSYTCICPEGMQINEDGWTCSAITTPDPGIVCDDMYFRCANGELCVQETVICDGYDDCGDRSDEQDCKPICKDSEFQCANGLHCVPMTDICDSENDCEDFSDEDHCECRDEKLQCRAWERRGECSANPGWMNWNCRLTCEVCLTTDGVSGGEINLYDQPEAYYVRNSFEFSKQLQWTLRNSGERPGNVGNQWSCEFIRPVPDEVKNDFRLSGLYQKYTEAFKIPILGLGHVDDDAMRRACYVIRFMMGDRRDLRQIMYKKWGRVAIMDTNGFTQMIPEHSHTDSILRNLRGLGGTLHIPVTTVGEENLLCHGNDRHHGEDYLIHTFAHAINKISTRVAQPDFKDRLAEAYNHARRKDLWANSKADDTVDEYFAEGVQAFFGVAGPYKYGVHSDIDNRDKLGRYDPGLHDLISEIFPCMNEIVDRCADQDTINSQPIKMNCKDAYRVRLQPTSAPTTPRARNDEDLPPDCQDTDGDCFDWAIAGECDENPGWMTIHCRRSCRSCQAEDYGEPSCADNDTGCEGWAADGECKVNPGWMMENCQRSCNNCPDQLACQDIGNNCEQWAEDGECTINPNYMEAKCRRTCQFC